MSPATIMQQRTDLLAYVPLAVTTTAAAVVGRERTHLASKMLLAPTLAAGVVASRGERPAARTATLVVALAGSAVGDWFMNGSDREVSDEKRRRVLMRRGAAAFAVQQTGLIRLLLADGVRPRSAPTAAVGGTMAAIGVIDTVANGGKPDPLIAGYGMLLGSMAALAMSDGTAAHRRRSVLAGGALFLLSDAAIIVSERWATKPGGKALASGVILSTYTAALALLVHGLRDAPTDATTAQETDAE